MSPRVTGKLVSSHMSALWLWSLLAFVPVFLILFATVAWVRGDVGRAACLAVAAVGVAIAALRRANSRGRFVVVVPPIVAALVSIVAYLLSGHVESIVVGVIAGVASTIVFLPRSGGRGIARPLDLMFDEAIPSGIDATLVLDDGGVRVTTGINHKYWAFAELGEPVISRSGEQVLLLLRDCFLEPIAELVVSDHEAASAFCSRLRERQDSPGGERPIPEGLARLDRDLVTWRSDLDELAQRGYRSAPISTATLVDIHESARAPLDIRAAAAYLLATREESREALFSSLGADTPPLCVALLSLSPLAERLDPRWTREARRYVPTGEPRKRIATAAAEDDEELESAPELRRKR